MSSPTEVVAHPELEIIEHNKDVGNEIPTTTSVSQIDIVELEEQSSSKDDQISNRSNFETLNVERKPSSRFSKSGDSSPPIFKVVFRDESVLEKYEEEIRGFLQKLIPSKHKKQCVYSVSNLVLKIWDGEDHRKKVQSEHNVTKSHNNTELSNDLLFTIDNKPNLKDNLDIPAYGKKYHKTFETFDATENTEKNDNCMPKLNCFNCSGNHNLRDCPSPRNQMIINKNRKSMMSKTGLKNTRYHLDDDQRFGHFVPGQLSKKLRRALGLKDCDLPQHIYKMRMLGYPPGWLEEARLQYSGISLINSDGSIEGHPDDEPGETICDGDRDQYDINKICDFPGFNIPPSPGIYDRYNYQWEKVRMIHSKETMLNQLKGKNVEQGYKRKKLRLSSTQATLNNAETIPKEMEIDEIEDNSGESIPVDEFLLPPLPKEVGKPPEPAKLTNLKDSECLSQKVQSPDSMTETTQSSSRTDSPSLSDLETIKNQLLVELDDSTGSQSPQDISVLSKKNPNGVDMKQDVTSPVSANMLTPTQHSRVQSVQNTPSPTNLGNIKSIDMGTPIFQSLSPFSKLPSSEKFSANICDVINFENLPDATGKYEKMSDLIQKVRDTVAKIQQE